MATDLVGALLSLATGETAQLLKDEIDIVQKQNPTLSPFDLVEKSLQILILDSKLPDLVNQEFRNIKLANSIAKISNVNVPLMTAAFQNPVVNSLRDFARSFDTSTIQSVVGDRSKQLAQAVRTEIFNSQPTATIQGMLEKGKIQLLATDTTVKTDVIGVLSKLDDKFISNYPMSTITTTAPDALNDVPPEKLPAVLQELNTLSRIQTISPTTTMMQHLASKRLSSALAVAQIPKSDFVNSVVETSGCAISAPVAAFSHDTSTTIVQRNENIIMRLLLKGRGTGLWVVDGEDIDRKLFIQEQIRRQGLDVNIDNLFGSKEQCLCDECNTVYSAASYLVDLLVYLRNNNLSPILNPNTSNSGDPDDISGTVLEALFKRRPDLGNLELTCENTNTILPYIDLANEVMESFIVNLGTYDTGPISEEPTYPQAEIDCFNVGNFQDSAELLSQPQNVNYKAYQTLASSAYPFSLPYHLPISTARAMLQSLQVSRGDLLSAFQRKSPSVKPPENYTVDLFREKIQYLQDIALNRQISAEYLEITQEEYIILTKEAFFTDEWFNITQNIDPKLSVDDYQIKVGVRQVWDYWGYNGVESMIDTTTAGLCFVKDQLLPRSGIYWADLVQIVQTNFVNPLFPQGRDKAILDRLRYSYRFLQTIIDSKQTDPKRRLEKLTKYLAQAHIISIAELISKKSQPTQSDGSLISSLQESVTLSDTPKSGKTDSRSYDEAYCVEIQELSDWVATNFEKMGKIIVLEFGEGPFLSDGDSPPGILSGEVFAEPVDGSADSELPAGLKNAVDGLIGRLSSDGKITALDGDLIATVTIGSSVLMCNSNKSINSVFPSHRFFIRSGQTNVAFICDGMLKVPIKHCSSMSELRPVEWVLNENQGSGYNIDGVRLQHLDGSSLDAQEWDRLHRFIRLWRKLKWDVLEVDRAIMALSNPVISSQTSTRERVKKELNQFGGDSNGTVGEFLNEGTNGHISGDDIVSFANYSKSESSEQSKPYNGNTSNDDRNTFLPPEINSYLIEQLSALIRVLPLVSLSVEQLLCFWSDIPTTAFAFNMSTTTSKSPLYERLFFASNLKKNDSIFGPNSNGDYLTDPYQKISTNLPIIMAAFNLKANEILYLLGANSDNFGVTNKAPIPDILNITNVSQIYRTALLSRILGIDVYDVLKAVQGFGPAFSSAAEFLKFIEWWGIMQNIKFPWEELRYIVDDMETPNDPLAPSATSFLATAKAINDEIEVVKSKYVIPTDLEKAYLECTNEIVEGYLAMLFDDNTAKQIIGLCDGTIVFEATNVPNVPEITDGAGRTFSEMVTLVSSGKLSYTNSNPRTAQLICCGILTTSEIELAKELVDSITEVMMATRMTNSITVGKDTILQTVTETKNMWLKAIDSLSVQPLNMFSDTLNGIIYSKRGLSETISQKETLLAGGISELNTQPSTDGKTPLEKRFCLMQLIVPHLQRIFVHNSVTDIVIAATGFHDRLVAKRVLENVMIDDDGIHQNTIDYLLEALKSPFQDKGGFDGYITVPADDFYVFLYPSESDTAPAAIILNGKKLDWTIYQESPKRCWTTDSAEGSLKSGTIYPISLQNIDLPSLEWKPRTSHRSPIPALSFMPRVALEKSLKVLDCLKKTAILVNELKLSANELIYIKEHKEDFDGMEFNSLSMAQLKRIQSYVRLRDSLPLENPPLIWLFDWCTKNPTTSGADLVLQISKATGWKRDDIDDILKLSKFSGGTANDFKNEKIMLKIQHIIYLSIKLGVNIPHIFDWSTPLGTSPTDFFKLRNICEDIQKVVRSKFDIQSWNDTVRPINDVLRQEKNKALISYLLVTDEVRKQGVTDADSLFEFFLMDVQATPPVETSRIKQAIATVQVFIQRCFLGLEKGIEPSRLDRNRWNWMSRYRVWEANRKVFLYPENWIDPTLRDDKSPFFLKLESELSQKDLTPDIVTSAIRKFLYSVNEVANLEMTALCTEKVGQSLVSTQTVPASITNSSASTSSTSEPNSGIGSTALSTTTQDTKIHIFAKTTTSPFNYYYISYSLGTWSAWSKMDIEIPYYSSQEIPVKVLGDGNRYMTAGKDTGVGSYMSPIVHAGRLLVFIPQITKKSCANPNQIGTGKTLRTLADHDTQQLQSIEQWEIKMSFTELQDGKWTQRQICSEGVLVENEQLSWNKNLNNGSFVFPADKPVMPAIETFSFVAAEIIKTDPNFVSNDHSVTPPKIPLGVRVIASKLFQLPPDIENFPCVNSLVGIGEWDFVDGKLSFVGDSSVSGGIDPLAPAPPMFVPMIESFTMNFHCQVGSTSESKVLYSLTATDDRSKFLVPLLDSFRDIPKVAKGKIASSVDSSVSAKAKEILIRKEFDPMWGVSVSKAQLLFHKLINPMMISACLEGTEDMPLMPLYSYLGGLDEVTAASNSHTTEYGFDSDGRPLRTHGFITSFVPPISDIDEAFGGVLPLASNISTGIFNERSTPFSLYNWEIALHAPMLLINRLLNMQQFEQALNVCHYVFNPHAKGAKNDMKKFWVFAPFKRVVTQTTEEMFLGFRANSFRQDVTDWRNNPFQPHVVARSRIQAYMMWIVMKYIEILIAYGDSYFRQNTLETIPDATQLYILASHLYGPRGQKITRQNPKKKYTYNQLATKFEAFSNVMVQLEEAFPFSNQTSLPVGKLPDDTSAPLANVFGFAGTLLFAIPDNPNLRTLGDTIDDRLFKLRHSQDINGLFRKLPLFEPPIDPALLVQATAQGVSISNVLQDLNGPMPNYRFRYLLSRALELAQEVKTFGSSLLAIREKNDYERLSLLRAKHDVVTQTVLMGLRKLSLDESNKSLEALQYARNAPVGRLAFYLQQIGADLSGIPEIDREFTELNAMIEKPVSVGGLQLMASEKEEMDKYALSADLSKQVSVLETIGASMNLLPTIGTQLQPLGMGTSIFLGGSNLGAFFQALARGESLKVSDANYQGSVSARKSQSMRALQDRILQANMAGHDIVSIDKQVTTSKIRIAMAAKDIDIQQKQIDQAHEVEDFLQQKYSNKELYSWMEGSTRSLYYESYTKAYELAKKAEKAFQFERPALKSTSFIKNGYWDSTRDGLLAGELLCQALKQLEAKYLEEKGYDYEITKPVSLRQLDPIQLITLRQTGGCEFTIPEVLFDMDYPGHYMRRLKSVSISVPCIVGPYTSINSTLRLTSHKIRFQPTRTSGDGYMENIADTDDRFTTLNVPITSIAACNGQNNTGTFELNFHDERYLPFEGAGAISAWSFSLPRHIDSKFRQFNWDSITDVIITLRYTSLDGGSPMMDGAQRAVKRYLEAADYVGTSGGLWGIFDLRNEFSTGWAKFCADQAAAQAGSKLAVLDIPALNEKLPVFASCRPQGDVLANDIYVLTDVTFPGKDISLLTDGKNAGELVLGNVKNVPNEMKCYHLSDDNGIGVGNWGFQLDPSSAGSSIGTKRAWLLFRYVLK